MLDIALLEFSLSQGDYVFGSIGLVCLSVCLSGSNISEKKVINELG